jgi:uncharacterized protein (TIGR02231 family)
VPLGRNAAAIQNRRYIMRLAFALTLCALPALADTIEAPSRVDQVTLYNWGATVSRTVAFDAPAGVHQIIVPDLPFGTLAETLRVAGSDGLTIGAVSLSTDRLPATTEIKPPAIIAAEAEIERLEAILRERDTAIATVRLRIEAANEQVAFLRSLGQGVGADTLTPQTLEQLRALSQMVGSEVLAARAAALAAETEAGGLERDRTDDQDTLNLAYQALNALQNAPANFAALIMTVETTGGAGQIVVTTQTDQASWYPVYDLRLTTGDLAGDAPNMAIDRGVVIAQYSGEDWLGVDLTLSTARPSDRTSPPNVFPSLRRIVEPLPPGQFAAEVIESPMVVVEPELFEDAAGRVDITRASFGMVGQTVVYNYGPAVDLRTGVDALRLNLDSLAVNPTLRATAVDGRFGDGGVYLVADTLNTSAEIILEGNAQLYLDGALIGSTNLPLIAIGDSTEIGFGKIDGLIFERTVPNRQEGEGGIITTSNEIDEEAVLRVENLTGKAWALRVIDQVPYSEQEDLQISYSAEPPETITDLDDKRGVLAWDMQIGVDETIEISLKSHISWPSGFNLQ